LSIIKKLPQEVISKIAAGEVVINPASVVKELVENSLDANATSIEVQIRNGGKSYIKVSDNGIGMSKEDMIIAIDRFTTSKISALEDIYNIHSYGFRGEALSSIAEVSRLIITSSDGNSAHRLEVIGGKIIKITETHREKGTTVEVYDLFFNIPARRKFLSSEKVETRMVTEIVEKFMLVQPSVSFVFKIEDEIVYNASKGSLEDRFSIIFPEVKEFSLIEPLQSEIMQISGIISSPQYTRRNRSGQIFFVNKRFVIDNLLNLSFERGYGEALAQGEHPYGVIFLDFLPDKIDVNIHPQKLQVKFSDPQNVYNEIARTIRTTLRKFSFFQMSISKNSEEEEKYSSEISNQNLKAENYQHTDSEWYPNQFKNLYQKETPQTYRPYEPSSSISQNLLLPQLNEKSLPKEFIVLKDRYIVFEDLDGLVIIDFHAAHERIIYEQLKENKFETVQLLIPLHIKLGKSFLQLSRQLTDEFKKYGFDFEIKTLEDGNGEVVIKQIPSILKVTDVSNVFLEILEEYRIPFEKPKGLTYVLASKACKSAVKTGDKLSHDEVQQIIKEIKSKNLLTCPHGRPIMMKLSFSQLDSFFERI